MDGWSSAAPIGRTRTAEFMASVYRWMAFGLALTGIVAGTVTKRDLGAWRSFLFIGLIGLILASIVNIFLRSNALEFVMSCAGVLIFAGLTAYDTQKLRQLGETGEERHALVGALALYLDFVNLFLFLLRFMGRRRE